MRKAVLTGITSIVIGLALVGTAFSQVDTSLPFPDTQGVKKCVISNNIADEVGKWADQLGIVCPATGGDCDFTTQDYDCAACCSVALVIKIRNIVFMGVLLASVLFATYGAYKIVSSKEDANQAKSGAKFVVFAAIGFIVAISVRYLPLILISLFGLKLG